MAGRYIRHGTFGGRGHRVGLLESRSSGVYFVDYYERATGKRITRSLETSDLDAAKNRVGDLIEQQKAQRPTRGNGETVLYVLQRGDNGPIKVGFSRSFKQRVRDLQCGNAEKLKVIRVYKMADVEKVIHAELERVSRLEGEWFPAELISLVDRFFTVASDVALSRAQKRMAEAVAQIEQRIEAGLL